MPEVLIIMGSKSDLPIAEKAVDIFKRFDIDYKVMIASAHRTPSRVEEIVTSSDAKVFIAIAGLAAALPGVVASFTTRPVIGVPVSGKMNLDALLSIVQMPPAIPVATVGVNAAKNAAVLAEEMLALTDSDIAAKVKEAKSKLGEKIVKANAELAKVEYKFKTN